MELISGEKQQNTGQGLRKGDERTRTERVGRKEKGEREDTDLINGEDKGKEMNEGKRGKMKE